MPTQLKSDTARANGAKSQGPKTASGRAKSSRNAVKHGLSSRNPLVLECENQADFQALHDHQMEIHQPANAAEADLVDQMIAARWRILRLQSIETEILDNQMRNKHEIEKEYPSGCPVRLSAAYAWEVDSSRAIALAARSEARLTRLYQSNYKILRELQAARMQQAQPSEAIKICNNEPKTAVKSDPPARAAGARSPRPHALPDPKSDNRNPTSLFVIKSD